MSDADESSDERPELDLPDAEESVDDEPELDEWWSWGNFARLFVFPLIIVIVSVGIYGTFQMMLHNQTTINDYISQMQTGPKNERWRAAYSLAQAVRSQEAQKKLTRDSVTSIIELYQNTKYPKMRQYLALILAEIPLKESIDSLVVGLKSDDPAVKVNTALALGRLYENAQNEVIKQQVQKTAPEIAKLLDDEKAEVRRMAAFVLGSLKNRAVIDELKNTLNDPASEVRWNGAIALGQLGNDTGEKILLKVLNRALKGNFSDWKPGVRRNLLVSAMQSLAKLDSKKALEPLRKIKESDQDSHVREVALKTIRNITQS